MSHIISPPGPVRLRLPATSANLGPGFDAVGLAMGLYLTIDAEVASSGAFTVHSTGRDAELCSQVENNLILTTYTDVLANVGVLSPRLSIRIENEIPLGMGCGSSAAAIVAGVLLANHFGRLEWTTERILSEACGREGHPDNVAACCLGGFTVSMNHGSTVKTSTYKNNLEWKLMLALPPASLSTSKARALLPKEYSREDAVANIQTVALLVSAFASGRGDLLAAAMQDRIHQPYRMTACPLLPALLPLSGKVGVLGVALSGAGPSVLLIADPTTRTEDLFTVIRTAAKDPMLEILTPCIAAGAEVLSCN